MLTPAGLLANAKGATIKKAKMKLLAGDAPSVDATFYPALRPIKNVPSGKVVFQLTANHPILGKMQSDWIAVND